MKRIFAALCAVSMVALMAACNNQPAEPVEDTLADTTPVEEVAEADTLAEDTTAVVEEVAPATTAKKSTKKATAKKEETKTPGTVASGNLNKVKDDASTVVKGATATSKTVTKNAADNVQAGATKKVSK